MLLIIITKGREGNVHTAKIIPPAWRDFTVICAPPEEKHPQFPVLPEPYPMVCSQKIQWIINGADGQLPDKVVILDDDISFSARDPENHTRLIRATPEQISAGFDRLNWYLDQYPLAGFHTRAMGNHAPRGYINNKRVMWVKAMNRALVGDIKVDHWATLSDMVLCIKLLLQGKPNVLDCELFVDHVGPANAPGGCSAHRTFDAHTEAVHGFRDMFPGFVTVKEKVTKSGWWGPDKPRHDFIVQWQKAGDYGRRNGNK
jgi:hypothetical protein